jgi:hypothetical protein
MSANQKRIYMAKVIFYYRDFVAGTENGGFRYKKKNLHIKPCPLTSLSSRKS